MDYREHNRVLLQEAENFYGESDICDVKSDLGKYFNYEAQIVQGQVLMICNDIFIENIITYEKRNYIYINYTKDNFPFYIYYEEEVFQYVCEHFNLENLLQNERIVLIVGKNNLRKYFLDYNVIYPNTFAGFKFREAESQLKEIFKERQKSLEQMKQESEEYYMQSEAAIKQRIRQQKFSVLFIVFEYDFFERIKEIYEVFRKNGLEVIIAGEECYIKRINAEYLINYYKPDAVFAFNRYRSDYPGVFPKHLVLITYLEDPRVPQYLSGYYRYLGKNDLIINIFYKYKRLKSSLFGNEIWREIPTNVIRKEVNTYVYSDITYEEHKKYDCDVCFICSQVDFLPLTVVLTEQYASQPNLQQEIIDFVMKLYESQYIECSIVIGKDQLENEVNKLLDKYDLAEEEKVNIFWYMYNIKYLIDRYIMLQWIIKENKYKVNIWGFGGPEVDIFRPYSRGKWKDAHEKYLAISCSKVVIQNETCSGLISPKFPEVLLNDSMMIAEYTEPSMEISDYNKYYQEGVGVVLYKDKKQLLEKIDFYISHEQARKEVIERGKEMVYKSMNFDKTIRSWIDAISHKF